ncbi:hypothetical protein [Runella sp.]|uniref:hypothetical protein n=1 Tax=Runella sp. TaxID=1960881 RepID=UPI003D14245C
MEQLLQILVFKTNIKTSQDKEKITPVLEALGQISRWTVDCEDCDCVLRIEADGVSEQEIIEAIHGKGFECAALTD